jgi:S1-C subfamily serine protease
MAAEKTTSWRSLYFLFGLFGLLVVVGIAALIEQPAEMADATPSQPLGGPVGSTLASGGESLTAREVAERSLPSVVVVTMQLPAGGRVFQGSGFVVRKGVVATNFHVIEGATSGYVQPVGRDMKIPILGVIASDSKRDLVLLAVPELEAPALDLADSQAVSVGDKIYVVGNPNGLEGTFADGIVSARRSMEELELIQVTAPISAGSSGGPLLDARGRVVGVAKGSWVEGQNLNFAVASAHVQTLLDQCGEIQQLTKVARPKAGKSRSSGGWFQTFLQKLRRLVPS